MDRVHLWLGSVLTMLPLVALAGGNEPTLFQIREGDQIGLIDRGGKVIVPPEFREAPTIGDPLMDLGTTLGYWIQAGDPPELQRIGLARFPGSLHRGEVVALYAERAGLSPSVLGGQIVYYYVFGLFKIAVIAQQIYYRYSQGHTKDARFEQLDAVVAACARMAEHAIASGSIEAGN